VKKKTCELVDLSGNVWVCALKQKHVDSAEIDNLPNCLHCDTNDLWVFEQKVQLSFIKNYTLVTFVCICDNCHQCSEISFYQSDKEFSNGS